MNKDIENFILDMMQSHNILTIATIREDGWLQAVTELVEI